MPDTHQTTDTCTITQVAAPLTEADAAAVRELAQQATTTDGVAPLSEQPLLWLEDPSAQVVHLLVRCGDALTGYAQVDLGAPRTASAELVIHPGHRRRGTGTALLNQVLQVAHSSNREISIWAHGNTAAAQAFTQVHDLVVVRELWSMRVDLAEFAPGPVALPEGMSTRPFRVGEDEEAWLKQNARAFADHPEQGRLTLTDLQAREREDWFDAAGFLLLEKQGKLLGSAWTKIVDGVGEIYVVGVVPSAQGQGLGHVLTGLGLNYLADKGLREGMLFVDGDNTSAIRTYEAAGFERSSVSAQYGEREH